MDFADYYWSALLLAFLLLEVPAAIWRPEWTLSRKVWRIFSVDLALARARAWLAWITAGGERPPKAWPSAWDRWTVLAGLLLSTLSHFLFQTSAVPIVAFGLAVAGVIVWHYLARHLEELTK